MDEDEDVDSGAKCHECGGELDESEFFETGDYCCPHCGFCSLELDN
jgi:DNA-directed RNA polymerase subunit RPC12/RpoP